MKIIEAMKRVKQNKEKISDLQKKIGQYCANLSFETNTMYGAETADKIKAWAQSCNDLSLDNVNLLTRISRTNLATTVSINLGGQSVTKNMAEWIWRRREYAQIDFQTWAMMTDRGLKEGHTASSTGGEPTKIGIVRHYDPNLRDEKLALYKSEPHEIDASLEVANAVTDLLE